jgi:hypothetical protein
MQPACGAASLLRWPCFGRSHPLTQSVAALADAGIAGGAGQGRRIPLKDAGTATFTCLLYSFINYAAASRSRAPSRRAATSPASAASFTRQLHSPINHVRQGRHIPLKSVGTGASCSDVASVRSSLGDLDFADEDPAGPGRAGPFGFPVPRRCASRVARGSGPGRARGGSDATDAGVCAAVAGVGIARAGAAGAPGVNKV